MTLEDHIEGVRGAIRAGRFANEAAICQGIVLRLLGALDWPAYDTDIVCPEFSLQGRRVDFALCHPPRKPVAFIEVKQPGQSDGAERQLFEYAFHEGIPLAILTNGQEWSFFLPGEQGSYGDRRFYKLDLLERDTGESAERLRRYLQHETVANGAAIRNAREDYQSIARQRQIERSLPEAWQRVVTEQDETLVQLLADRVELICGFKPDPDVVAAFLRRLPFTSGYAPVPPSFAVATKPPQQTASRSAGAVRPVQVPLAPPTPRSTPATPQLGFTLDGDVFPCRNATSILRTTMEEFQRRDPTFMERFAALPRHGRIRRYLSRSRDELFPGRPDLCAEYADELPGGWYLNTHFSRHDIGQIVKMACEVVGVGYGSRYILHLSD